MASIIKVDTIKDTSDNTLLSSSSGDLVISTNLSVDGGTIKLDGNYPVGSENVALGNTALESLTTGNWNTAIGKASLQNNTSGIFNTAVGRNTLNLNTTGSSNTGLGMQALYSNITGGSNVAVGYEALKSNTASNNTAVGYLALTANTSGTPNTALGAYALDANTTGSENTGIGQGALGQNTTGTNNVGVGGGALNAVTTGSYNTAVGRSALINNTASDNTALGMDAGSTITTGASNVIIGKGAQSNNATSSRNIVIGSNVTGVTAGDTVTIGNTSTGRIYNQFNVNATWTRTSDERYKKNITDDTLGLSFINRLRPVTFNWKGNDELDQSFIEYSETNLKDTTTTIHGLIAQEVKQALDDEGNSTFNGWNETLEGTQGISGEMFIFPLIKAIKELSAKVDTLQEEVNTLKGT